MKKISVIILIILMGVLVLSSGCNEESRNLDTKKFDKSFLSPADNLTIQVVYDNNLYDPELETAWGFSCYIQGPDKNILFDTGGDGQILLNNMEKLKINPNDIDIVFLSHIHGDHTGGLPSFLGTNSDVTVYLPDSFPENLKSQIKECSTIAEVSGPVNIGKNCFSTGELGNIIREQALLIKTEKGLVLITGCAHPGIVNMVKAAKELSENGIFLVMGGFHLEGHSNKDLMNIISEFKDMGVEYAGPCHCSGLEARKLFEKEYGKKYVEIGVGKKINTNDL